MIDPLINDWIYWEAGKVIVDIRNDFHNRIKIAFVLICLGAIVIFLWRNTSTGTALLDNILLERRKELAFEGHRY